MAQPGATATRATSLTVDVSVHDGQTWHAVPVRDGTVTIDQPTGETFVSLRASAADAARNTVQQTIIRACRVAPGPSRPDQAH